MKRFLSLPVAATLAIAICGAQTPNNQTKSVMSAGEFRQMLHDLSTYLDAHKGTDLTKRLESLSDEGLMMVYPAIADPRGLQSAVARLKQSDAARSASTGQMLKANAPNIQPNLSSGDPVYPDCPHNTIIDDASTSTCTPSYPDPSNSAWQFMVAGPGAIDAFTSPLYSVESRESCSLTATADLNVVVSALQGAVLVSSAICGALPPIASNVCWAVESFIGYSDAVSVGTYAACQQQSSFVTGAQVEAAFHNTVTNYNALQGLGTQVTNLSTQLTGVDTQVASEISALDNHLTGVDTHLTNVNTAILAAISALDAHMVALYNQLSAQLKNENLQSLALMKSYSEQIMELTLTPDSYKQVYPPVLTCTGTNCPDVLTNCQRGVCSWGNTGFPASAPSPEPPKAIK